eukprot:TRINITY_DN56911_c0_g1_i1.p1 TRINITY_DN56911_c0_g1~~TRINITY_DN56911_c0_g1_i1.p1  ORF type:complete len:705 (+),score=138.41 TRINITY_DN56911_c0_g1_i1:161-2275(+)
MSELSASTSGGTGHVLPSERARASFDIAELQKMIGGAARQEAIDRVKELFTGPPFDDAHLDDFRSYQELFERQSERAVEATKILRKSPEFRQLHAVQRKVSMSDLFATGALGIHFIAFLPYLETQANDAQKKQWLAGARNLEYIGAYAQTELGHGSNVRALETIATFDPHTDEFVIHSPTLTSIKWWPTGMYVATHGIVFAQLHLHGKNHGVHGFMVQFRDDKGCLMPGVEVGEIGPKIDARHTNIGYARFTHVRIPRFNMFARNSQVTPDGNYVPAPPKLSKFGYIGMMTIRAGMVGGAYALVATAVTTAVRYLCIRKQGFKDSTASDALSTGEHAVLDYQLHQYRAFKALACAYAFFFSTRYVHNFLARVRDGIMAGEEQAADGLPELHATLAGMKTFCTWTAHQQVEAMRKSCGGQGYLRASGVGDLAQTAAEPVTAEGEHVILALQTARFLMKTVRSIRQGTKVVGTVAYMAEPPLKPEALGPDACRLGPDASAPAACELALALLLDRARRFAEKLEAAFAAETAKGAAFDDALNKVMVLAYKSAECHTMYILAKNNFDEIQRQVQEGAMREALLRLFEVFALQQIYENAGDFLGILPGTDLILARINRILEEIRPDAVALTDGFSVSDWNLKSTLGRYDGNVYEAIYEEAKLSPLNQDSKMIGWEKFAEILDLDFLREGMTSQRQGGEAPSHVATASKL